MLVISSLIGLPPRAPVNFARRQSGRKHQVHLYILRPSKCPLYLRQGWHRVRGAPERKPSIVTDTRALKLYDGQLPTRALVTQPPSLGSVRVADRPYLTLSEYPLFFSRPSLPLPASHFIRSAPIIFRMIQQLLMIRCANSQSFPFTLRHPR